MLSPYVTNIRRKIGNDFLMLPSVTILVRNEENKLLMVRHHNNNVWVAPGGMIGPDETPAQSAIREMKEETGCDVEIVRLQGVYSGPLFYINYANGDKVGYITTVFEARITGGEPQPDGTETLEVGFFTNDEIRHLHCEPWMLIVLDDLYLGRFSMVYEL